MNGDEAFKLQLGQWLQEGPERAPREPIATALARIRDDPARPRTLGSLWRQLMSGIGLTRVPSQPRRTWGVVAIAAAIVIVVAGGYGLFNLGGQIGPGGGPTPTPAVTPTPTPRPTREPTPTLGPGMATGSQTCSTTTDGVVTTVNGVDQGRGEVNSCRNFSTDPRLAGDFTTTWNWDEYPDGLWLGWGAIELRNDGGAWAGTWAAESTSTASVMEFDSVWIGTGGYDGLEVLNHVRIGQGGPTVTNRVFEVGPAVTGTETCTIAKLSQTSGSADVTHVRGGSLRCTDTMSDPRVGGTRTVDFSIDTPTGADGETWGTSTLTNDDGTWEGFFFGTVDATDSVNRVKNLMRGTGAYEGLFLRLEAVGSGDLGFDLTGEIVAGW